MNSLHGTIEADLGVAVVGMSRVGGGDMAEAFAADLVDGRRVFAKTHEAPPAGFFSREAADLRWLRDAGALPVPEVLAVSDEAPARLVLEWIEPGRRGGSDEAAFGRNLASLHASGAEVFGRVDGRTTGSQALPNDPCDSWVEFFAERRLRPLAQMALDRNALPERLVAALDSTADRLEELGGPAEPPARLHGDLWAGNRMVDSSDQSWLIDPAAHGGHREFDLAMMRLFGGVRRRGVPCVRRGITIGGRVAGTDQPAPARAADRACHQVWWRIRGRCSGRARWAAVRVSCP